MTGERKPADARSRDASSPSAAATPARAAAAPSPEPAVLAGSTPDPPVPFDAKGYVESLPARPGVYRMLDAHGEILYVGKARNLKSPGASYFPPRHLHPQIPTLS